MMLSKIINNAFSDCRAYYIEKGGGSNEKSFKIACLRFWFHFGGFCEFTDQNKYAYRNQHFKNQNSKIPVMAPLLTLTLTLGWPWRDQLFSKIVLVHLCVLLSALSEISLARRFIPFIHYRKKRQKSSYFMVFYTHFL